MADFASPGSRRAFERAGKALSASGNFDKADPETTLVDTLADLMTWAHLADVDFEDCLERAAKHYAKETIAPDDLAQEEF